MRTEDVARWAPVTVATTAVVLIAVRMLWPGVKFDDTSLWLFGIAAAALLSLYIPISSVKFGEIEVKTERVIQDVQRKVEAVEQAAAEKPFAEEVRAEYAKKPGEPSWEDFFERYVSIVNSASSNVEKLVSAAILIEQMIRSAATAYGVHESIIRRGPRAVIDHLAEQDLISQEERSAFHEFWFIRNRIVHGDLPRPSDIHTARLLDLGWRLVRMLA